MKKQAARKRKRTLTRSMRVFLILFASLLLVSCAGVSMLGAQMIRSQQTAYASRLERETQRMFHSFNQYFESAQLSCNAIFSSRWYMHYRNVANIYQKEFTALKRMEISQALQSILAGLPCVSDILVVTPAYDTVISRSGWYSLDGYQTVYPSVRIDASQGFETSPLVDARDSSVCVLTLPDPTFRRDKSVIAIVVDRNQFSSHVLKMLPEHCLSIDTTLSGHPLCRIGDARLLQSARASSSVFTFTAGYLPFERAELPSLLALLFLLLSLLVLLSALLSLLAMRVVTRPAAQMVLDAGGEKSDLADPFQFLQNYLSTLSSQSNRLSSQNEDLIVSQARLLSAMKNEIYASMLTNPRFNYTDDSIRSVLPAMPEDFVCALLLFTPRRDEDGAPVTPLCLDAFRPLAAHVETACVHREQAVFLWFPGAQSDACIQAARSLIDRMGLYYGTFVCVPAPQDFHAAYIRAHQALDRLRRERLELPVSVENRIVNLLRANYGEKCRQYVETLRGQYTADALIRLFIRIGAEVDCALRDMPSRFADAAQRRDEDAQWALLGECALLLSSHASAAQRKPSENSSAQSICQFIQEHYTDPDLCINQLAERFCLHRTLVSKLIKQHTGLTFSDWCQQLRIEDAVQLLRESDLSAAAIAEQVGYANYTTFKRAFIRQCGCTPREYAQDAHASNPSPCGGALLDQAPGRTA